jgi:hypothetical protein
MNKSGQNRQNPFSRANRKYWLYTAAIIAIAILASKTPSLVHNSTTPATSTATGGTSLPQKVNENTTLSPQRSTISGQTSPQGSDQSVQSSVPSSQSDTDLIIFPQDYTKSCKPYDKYENCKVWCADNYRECVSPGTEY